MSLRFASPPTMAGRFASPVAIRVADCAGAATAGIGAGEATEGTGAGEATARAAGAGTAMIRDC